MDTRKLDPLRLPFSDIRSSRRAALASLGAGVAALSGFSVASAQDATPDAGFDDADRQQFLFVQLANGGIWSPSPDEERVFLLTLSGASNQTLFFSDRPERIVGSVPTPTFLEALGFTPTNAPNAALVVRDEAGQRDVLVVELFDPVFTQAQATGESTSLTYKARVLDSFAGANLEQWQIEQEDDQLDHTFTDVSLFIDDCPDMTWCNGVDATRDNNTRSMGPVPGGPIGTCWNGDSWECWPCNGHDPQDYYDACNQTYPDCNATCEAQPNYYP